MDRKLVYAIVILLTITLVVADFYMNRSLESVEYLQMIDDGTVSNGLNVDDIEIETYMEEEPISYTNLTLSNKQSDKKKNTYTYTIKIDKMSGAHKYIKADGTSSYQVFSANGETTLTLNSNETVKFTDVPVNASYTITQEEVDGYKTYIGAENKKVISGVITKDGVLTFNNIANDVSESVTPVEPTKPEEPVTPSEPVTPETPTEPEKPTTSQDPGEDKKNPTTSDKLMPAVILLVILSGLLIISLRLRIKRFE